MLTLNNYSRKSLNEAILSTCSIKINLRGLNLRVNVMRLEIEFEFRDFCRLLVSGDVNRSVFVP